MDFKWLNQGEINIEDDRIEMVAPPQSDFFCNNGAVSEVGITPESLCNAPFYFTEVTGDFVMQVKVSHDFKDTYDSASVMVMVDLRNWAKACFEKTGASNALNRSTKLFISGSVCAMLNGRASGVPSELRMATVLLDFDTSIPTAIMGSLLRTVIDWAQRFTIHS